VVSYRVVVGAVLMLTCVGVIGGSLVAAGENISVTGEADSVSGAAGDSVTITVSIENTGATSVSNVSLHLQGLSDGLNVVETSGDGAYNDSKQAFNYLSIASDKRVSSTITIKIDSCAVPGADEVSALIVDDDNETIQQVNSTVNVQPRDSDKVSRLGPNDRRNCIVDPAVPASFPRDCVESDRPVIVYPDERIGVESVPQSDSRTSIGSGETRFVGVSGPADGDIKTVKNARDVKFQSFEPGGYSTDDTGPDAEPELIIHDPAITDLALHTRPGRTGVNVSNGLVTQEFPAVYLNPRYNFDDADRLEITVRDPEGTDVTSRILADGEDRFVTSSTQDTELNFSDSAVGTHTVSIKGDAICPVATTSIDVISGGLSVTASETVTRGESTVVTLSGQPGRAAHIRIPADSVASEESEITAAAQSVTASQLFSASGDIDKQFYDSSTDSYVATVRRLDGDGQAKIQLRTDQLKDGIVQVSAASTPDPTASAVSVADINIKEATLTLDDVPPTVNAQQEFTLRGRAERGDEFGAYVRINDSWRRIPRTDDKTGTTNNQYQLNLSATGPISITGDYRVAVTRDVIVDGESFPQQISDTEWRQLDRSKATLLRVRPPALQTTLSNPGLAYGTTDESVVSGRTAADSVRLYRVSPAGDIHTTTIELKDGSFSRELAPETRGTHHLVVVAPGRDGQFVTTDAPTVPAAASPTAVVTSLVAHHTEDGRDDLVQTKTLTVEEPSVSATARYNARQLQLRGTTNRANGTPVYIKLQTAEKTLLLTNATIEGGTFRRSISLSDDSASLQNVTAIVIVGDITRRVSTTEVPAEQLAQTQTDTTKRSEPPSTAQVEQAPGRATAAIKLSDVSNGLQKYNVTVSVSGAANTSISDIEPEKIAGNEFQVVNRPSNNQSVTFRGVDLTQTIDQDAGTLTLATVELTNGDIAPDDIEVAVHTVTDDDGSDISSTQIGPTIESHQPTTSSVAAVRLNNISNGLQKYNLTVSVAGAAGTNIDTIEPGVISANEFQIVNRPTDNQSVTFRGVDLTQTIDQDAGTLTLATLNLTSGNITASDVDVTVHTVTDDDGNDISPTQVDLTIEQRQLPSPSSASSADPTDTNAGSSADLTDAEAASTATTTSTESQGPGYGIVVVGIAMLAFVVLLAEYRR
jgi:hypothetical protein